MRSLTLCPISIGQRLSGVSRTPKILSNKIIKKHKNLQIYKAKINNSYHEKDHYENLLNTMKYCEYFYYLNCLALNNNKLNINIGGDHSMAIGTIPASVEKYKDKLKVLWIDAHADINSLQKSRTKNIHGMPVNFLMRQRTYEFGSWLYDNQITPEQIMYIGLRDVDEYEMQILKDNNIEFYTPSNLYNNMANIIEKLNNYKIHLSLDVDGISPCYIPSTGTPVQKGIDMGDLHFLVSNIKDNIVNCDFSELNLDLGSKNDKEISLINSLLFFDMLLK